MSAVQAVANDSPSEEILGHYINGKTLVDKERLQAIHNPATGKVIRHVALAGRASVEKAIAAAAAAWPAWRETPPMRRARIMFRFKDLLEQHAEAIIALLTEEHGKVLDDARASLFAASRWLNMPVLRRSYSKGSTAGTWRRILTAGRSARRWALSLVLPRLTFRPWCPCGCTPWRLSAATPSCSNRPSRTQVHRLISPDCCRKRACRMGCLTWSMVIRKPLMFY